MPGKSQAELTGETRRQFDRSSILLGVLFALLVHFAVIGGVWFFDLLSIKDVGDWTGPILVKIGSPSAAAIPVPDISAAAPKQSPQEVESASETPNTSRNSPVTTAKQAVASPPKPPAAASVKPVPKTISKSSSQSTASESIFAASAEAVLPPKPARVQGRETGNTYIIEFDGMDGEVGRAGAYEFITSYMPLPNTLNAALVDNAREYLKMSPDFIRAEIEKYWEPFRGGYIKRSGNVGEIPLGDRPWYWSMLVKAMGYDVSKAEWNNANMRPVVVEFFVLPSDGAKGAQLTDFNMISRTNNPRVDEAVQYGLSRWVYYNNTNKKIRGRISYAFDR